MTYVLTKDIILQLQQLAKLSYERGGYISFKDRTRPKIIIESKKGTKRGYEPLLRNLSVRNVIRFHTHPDTSMETPPSDQDYIQTCKDYVQRGDGIPYHMVVCPRSLFLLEIAPDDLQKLDVFIQANRSLSGVKRKEMFLNTSLLMDIENKAKKMIKYQTCLDEETKKKCVKNYIKNIRQKCNIPITWYNVSRVVLHP